MKIRFFSFDFDTSKYLTKEDFLQYLLSCNEGDFDLGGKRRIFYLQEHSDNKHYVGLLVTIKDHKTYTTLKAKKIKISDVGKDQDLIELNYFVMHKKSMRVLYQYYHQSCSLNQFILFLNMHHRQKAEAWIEVELKKQDALPPKKRKSKRKLAQEFGQLMYSVTVRPEDLPTLLEDLSQISTFEYPIQTLEVAGKKSTQPLSGHVQRIIQRITFNRDGTLNEKRKALLKYIKDKKISKGTVRGPDSGDVPRVIDLCENAAYHAEYEFDDLISKLDDGDVTELENNEIIKELLMVAGKIKLSLPATV